MNNEQIKSRKVVAKGHQEEDLDASLKAVASKQAEVHYTQTHAIFEMVSKLKSSGNAKRFSILQLALVMACFWSCCALGGKLWNGTWWFDGTSASNQNFQFNRESLMAMKALLNDSAAQMDESTTYIATRNDGTRRGMKWDRDWSKHLQDHFVELAIAGNRSNVLDWIATQDGGEILPRAVQSPTNKLLAPPTEESPLWLWCSHFLQIAVSEDDSKYLEKSGAFAMFLKDATTFRIAGYISILLDGNHPNCSEWLESNHPEIWAKRAESFAGTSAYAGGE